MIDLKEIARRFKGKPSSGINNLTGHLMKNVRCSRCRCMVNWVHEHHTRPGKWVEPNDEVVTYD